MRKDYLNKSLQTAKNAKRDEFYTQLSDIEEELQHYTKHFKGKVVLCNCDDPRRSNFFTYFAHNFKRLGLKKLIVTCYRNQEVDLFSENNIRKGLYLEYVGKGRGVPVADQIGIKELAGDGDFRSAECVDFLKQSDIVVTNPPFSFFREYLAQLIKYDKKFLIVGNINAISNTDTFPLFMEHKLWLGVGFKAKAIEFQVPDHYNLTTASGRIDMRGNKFKTMNTAHWFTNLEHYTMRDPIFLSKTYKGNEREYPKYDNYDAIEVKRLKNIPIDYEGEMGVPLTFMDKHNPDQFEIIGTCRDVLKATLGKGGRFSINNKILYPRLVIKRARKADRG